MKIAACPCPTDVHCHVAWYGRAFYAPGVLGVGTLLVSKRLRNPTNPGTADSFRLAWKRAAFGFAMPIPPGFLMRLRREMSLVRIQPGAFLFLALRCAFQA
jgi:hypothetical protein